MNKIIMGAFALLIALTSLVTAQTTGLIGPKQVMGNSSATTKKAPTGTSLSAMGIRALVPATTMNVATTGNDTNTCFSGVGSPCLTLQGAYNKLVTYDTGGSDITISVANGTYSHGAASCLNIAAPWTGGGNLNVVGNTGTPANVICSGTGGGITVNASTPGYVFIDGITINSTGCCSLLQNKQSILAFNRLIFGYNSSFQIAANAPGALILGTNSPASGFGVNATYTIAKGAANGHMISVLGGQIQVNNGTITLSGTTVTITNANPGVITETAHNRPANSPVIFATTGALPTNIVAGTTYFIKTVLTANTYTISATAGGAAIDTTAGAQSGVQSTRPYFPGFLIATRLGGIDLELGVTGSFLGAATPGLLSTGSKCGIDTNAIIYTGNGGASLPGTGCSLNSGGQLQ